MVHDAHADFYPFANAAPTPFAAGQLATVVLTRDGTTMAGYVNGAQQFTFNDATLYGTFSGPNTFMSWSTCASLDSVSIACAIVPGNEA